MIATTKSQQYNPWSDLNGDGKIDILDVVGVTGIYATTGDPTKSVIISGHVTKQLYNHTEYLSTGSNYFISPWISVEGYSKFSVCIATGFTMNSFYVAVSHVDGLAGYILDGKSNFGYEFVKTYDVANQLIEVVITNNDVMGGEFVLEIYAIA